MTSNKLVIVVPIYKEINDITERLSLEQLYRVLGRYDIIFVAPERMEEYCHQQGYFACFFKDRYFLSTSTYSELLLSDAFYAQFAEYDYMLIYQLDAFVFKDELMEFCDLGYDYIGAPIPRNASDWKKINARVGNGGLSLRKISSSRNVVKKIKKICKDKDLVEFFHKYEDMFFGYCGQREDIKFRVPDVSTALRFSIDEEVSHSFRKLRHDNLPLGCHGWSRPMMYPLWRSYLTDDEALLGKLDDYYSYKRFLPYKTVQWYRNSEYIISRFVRYHKSSMGRLCGQYLNSDSGYVIWGYGMHGKMLHRIFIEFGYTLLKIIDKGHPQNEFDQVEVTAPQWSDMENSNYVILISAIDYDNEIKEEILSHGIEADRIIVYRYLLDAIISNYMALLCGHTGTGSENYGR